MHLPDDARWVRRVCAIMYAVAQTYTQTHTRTPCTMPLPYHAHTHAESRARIKDVCEGTGSHFNDARVSNNRKKKYTHTHTYTLGDSHRAWQDGTGRALQNGAHLYALCGLLMCAMRQARHTNTERERASYIHIQCTYTYTKHTHTHVCYLCTHES